MSFVQQNDTLILEELVGDRLEVEEVGRRGEEQEVGIYWRIVEAKVSPAMISAYIGGYWRLKYLLR